MKIGLLVIIFIASLLSHSTGMTSVKTPASLSPLPKFFIGYNEGWFGNAYGTDLTTKFNPEYVEEVFEGIRSIGGDVVRLWIFENLEGIQLSSSMRTTGVDASLLKNISIVLDLARQKDLRVYLTLFDGAMVPKHNGSERSYYLRLFNNVDGEGDAFRELVLSPLLQVLGSHRDIIYGMDLINEIEGPIVRGYWKNPWEGPRQWIKFMRSFLAQQADWLRVSVSSGWHLGYITISGGLFSGLGLDFYDLHAYANSGLNAFAFLGACHRANQDKVPLILGEFGQLSKVQDDRIQMESTMGFLKTAHASCFAGALAWRYDKAEKWWNFQKSDGSFRPAALKVLEFKSAVKN